MIDKNFNEYMEEFKSKTLKEKENITFEQLKILAVFTNNMCKQVNMNNEILINKELIDINGENYTEDDFVEASLVLINSIQNSLSDFSIKLTDIMEYITNKQ